jgi:uncharacterized repeat protein (TIGR01451 family)
MKIQHKFTVLALSGLLGLFSSVPVFAATSATLTDALSYSVLAGSTVTNVGPTTVSGNLGISPSIGVAPHYTNFPPGLVGPPGVIHDADANAALAQADNTAAFGFIDQGCDQSFAGVQDLTLLSPLAPGVYCANAFILTGNLTLTGNTGVWIFKSASTIITSPGSSVTGGDPCNVWWRAVSSVTLDTTTSFIGNVLASTAITMNNGATLNGRAMTQTSFVALDNNTISGPVCTAAPSSGGSRPAGSITVVKNVINDNTGNKTVADFSLFMNGAPIRSGETYYRRGDEPFVITETPDAAYTRTFSGACDASGRGTIGADVNKVCIVTNNDVGAPAVAPVPPLIDVVKVPDPLNLPDGPGPVEYTYTLRNIGVVPVSNVTMVGDTCSPIVLVSGDTNSDAKLDVNETWVHTCSTTLSESHTNVVVATGWANGISATDIASATVLVGIPQVPPLIHVTKVPSPLNLSDGGGVVTYTEKITNPGTVPLSNVRLTDDKCGPMVYVSGDVNVDLKLDTNETWTYDCKTYLTETTTNTAIATGEANGFIVTDFAVVTVPVAAAPLRPAAPRLPNTGVDPNQGNLLWNVLIVSGVFTGATLATVNWSKEKK